MKKIIAVVLLALILAGCRTVPEFRPDTIVDIPLEPTQSETQVTETVTEAPTETEPVTEAPTEPATEKPTEKPKGSSSGKENTGKKPASTKPTETAAEKPTEKSTEPPTQPPTETPTEVPTEPPTEPPTQAPTRPSVSAYSPTALDYSIVDTINAHRAEAGLPSLTMDSRLCTAAAQRARELPLSWSHTRPGGSNFTTVLADFGVAYTFAAENLYNSALSFTADTVVSKWMNSDSHRANLLSEQAASIGVATHSADGFTYIAALIVG